MSTRNRVRGSMGIRGLTSALLSARLKCMWRKAGECFNVQTQKKAGYNVEESYECLKQIYDKIIE
jgi:hypothetical protein